MTRLATITEQVFVGGALGALAGCVGNLMARALA